jgi:alkylation response protein AidB-like acyl-CoA dehydrogenase
MLLTPTADQEVLRATTARFLDDRMSVDVVRSLRDDPTGYPADYWTQGAELGWAALLVSEDNGGGTVSGFAVQDLSLIAHEFGTHAAPGPLVPVNVVARALDASGSAGHLEVLGELLSGSATAAWCYGEAAPHDRLGDIEVSIRGDGSDLVIDGVKRPVEGGADAAYLLVTGRSGAGLSQVLIRSDAPGVTVRRLSSADLTRRFAEITFDQVRVPADAVVETRIDPADQVARQLHLALALHAAESVGAMQRAFDMTQAWAADRYSFGRALASYQAIKHRFADMASWLEGGHAISDAAITAIDADAPETDELVHAAAAFIGDYGTELLQECVQLHGGIGVTFEHDLHLFLRRVTVNRASYGTPAQHRRKVGELNTQRRDTA